MYRTHVLFEKGGDILWQTRISLVDALEPEDLVVVNRKDNQTIFERLDEKKLEQWLSEYSLGELWEKNVIGGRPSW